MLCVFHSNRKTTLCHLQDALWDPFPPFAMIQVLLLCRWWWHIWCSVLRSTAWCSCLSPPDWETPEGRGGAFLVPVSPAPGPEPDTHPDTKELFMPSVPHEYLLRMPSGREDWISRELSSGKSSVFTTAPSILPSRMWQSTRHPPSSHCSDCGLLWGLSGALLRGFPLVVSPPAFMLIDV